MEMQLRSYDREGTVKLVSAITDVVLGSRLATQMAASTTMVVVLFTPSRLFICTGRGGGWVANVADAFDLLRLFSASPSARTAVLPDLLAWAREDSLTVPSSAPSLS